MKKKVLITGASKGLGLAIAHRLAEEYTLILHATKEESLSFIPSGSHILCADFSNNDELEGFCKRLKHEHADSLFGIINNAGITHDKPLNFQPEREIDAMLQVNLKAPIMICKTAMKIFNLTREGVIINMSSVVAETGHAFQSVYSATKAGLISFSKSLAQEAASLNETHEIRVLSVCPGFIDTSMTEKIPEAIKDDLLKLIPSKRFGRPDEVAETIAFLLSKNASYINGSKIDINGGLY